MESNRDHSKVGIYIHVPFCEKKCFYCDFYSIENHALRNEFLISLVKEIDLFSRNHAQRFEADTIFFGGGTPSLLTAIEINRIMEALRSHFDVSPDAEITIECNPGTVSLESLSSYRQLGINRLSFGVQSFFEDELKFLSRIHDSHQAIEAVMLARKSGFENINLDLMYGLPGQTIERAAANLAGAVKLKPEHISAYNLIVEPGTPLFASVSSGHVKPLDESTESEMYDLTMSFLEKNGFEHYEISNYSRPGFQCRHNLKYWNCQDYVSFGPSAHSYLDGMRWWNVSSLTNYVSNLSASKLPISADEILTETQLVDEFMMLQLRQGQIDLRVLKDRFMVEVAADFISDLEMNGYASVSNDRVLLTRKGFTVSDRIAEEISGTNLMKLPRLCKAG